MPRVGLLYRRVGGGLLTMHAGLNGQVSARIMADMFDVGFTTGWMPVADFWRLVDTGPDAA